MKSSRFWAIFLTGILVFSTISNDYIMTVNAEETDCIEQEVFSSADSSEVEEADGEEEAFTVDGEEAGEAGEEAQGGGEEAGEAGEEAQGDGEEAGEAGEAGEEALTDGENAGEGGEEALEGGENAGEGGEEALVDGEEAGEEAEEALTDDAESEDVEAELPEGKKTEAGKGSAEEEIVYPAISASDCGVTVEAPEGAFPDGTTVKISEVTVSAGELGLNEDECEEIRAWDVTFYYNDEEIQPKDGKVVSVNLNIDGMGDDVEAYHIHDGAVSEIQIDEEGTVSTSTFSLLAAVAKGKKEDDSDKDDENDPAGVIETVITGSDNSGNGDPGNSGDHFSLAVGETKTFNLSGVSNLVSVNNAEEINTSGCASAEIKGNSISITGLKESDQTNLKIYYTYTKKNGKNKTANKIVHIKVTSASEPEVIETEYTVKWLDADKTNEVSLKPDVTRTGTVGRSAEATDADKADIVKGDATYKYVAAQSTSSIEALSSVATDNVITLYFKKQPKKVDYTVYWLDKSNNNKEIKKETRKGNEGETAAIKDADKVLEHYEFVESNPENGKITLVDGTNEIKLYFRSEYGDLETSYIVYFQIHDRSGEYVNAGYDKYIKPEYKSLSKEKGGSVRKMVSDFKNAGIGTLDDNNRTLRIPLTDADEASIVLSTPAAFDSYVAKVRSHNFDITLYEYEVSDITKKNSNIVIHYDVVPMEVPEEEKTAYTVKFFYQNYENDEYVEDESKQIKKTDQRIGSAVTYKADQYETINGVLYKLKEVVGIEALSADEEENIVEVYYDMYYKNKKREGKVEVWYSLLYPGMPYPSAPKRDDVAKYYPTQQNGNIRQGLWKGTGDILPVGTWSVFKLYNDDGTLDENGVADTLAEYNVHMDPSAQTEFDAYLSSFDRGDKKAKVVWYTYKNDDERYTSAWFVNGYIIYADGSKIEDNLVVYDQNYTSEAYPNGNTFTDTDLPADKKTSYVIKSYAATGLADREGYRFLGWSLDKNASSPDPRYDPDDTITDLNTYYTFYAIWEKKAEITVYADSAEKTYDKTELKHHKVRSVEGLPEGWEVTEYYFSTASTVTEPGSADNVIEKATVYDASGEPASADLYDITFVPGTLKVTADIKVYAQSAEKKYNKEELICHEIEKVEGLPEGWTIPDDSVVFSADSRITEPGSVPNVITSASVNDASGEPASEDLYKIEFIPGTLKITGDVGDLKAKVKVVGYKGVYDGEEHGAEVFVTGQGINSGADAAVASDEKTSAQYIVSKASSDTTRTNVGDVAATVSELEIKDAATGEVVTDKFDLDYDYTESMISITPAPFSVVTESKTKVDDGTPLTASGSYEGLVPRDKAKADALESAGNKFFEVTGKQVGVGFSENTFVLNWDLLDKETADAVATFAVSDGSGSMKDNYTVVPTVGTLTIVPRDEEPDTPVTPDTPDTPDDKPKPKKPKKPNTPATDNTPDTPVTPDDTSDTPDILDITDTPVTPALPLVNIIDTPVPLQGTVPQVLGARRMKAVLGADRKPQVLGARRAETGDESMMGTWGALSLCSLAGFWAYLLYLKKRRMMEALAQGGDQND